MADPSLAEAVCEVLQENHAEDLFFTCSLAQEMVARTSRQMVEERSLEDVAALVAGSARFLLHSRPGEVQVEVTLPEEEGWQGPVTLVRALLGDRPFIVDTLREYLGARDLTIRNFIYPVLGLERSAAGEVVQIGPPAAGREEALIYIEMERVEDAAERETLRREIQRHLEDVAAVTDDFRAMLHSLDDTNRLLGEYEERFPSRSSEFQEVQSFLSWLREGNFVFLGFRAYDVLQEEEPVLAVTHGSGRGILRHEEESAWAYGVPLSDVEEEIRSRLTSGPLLIISKTNAVSTVHRRDRMDYIGVKLLDEHGAVAGERRFLGLFTSQAYAERAEAIPILRDKLSAILARSGAPAGSHDYKEIVTIFNSMPKEDLFHASTAELEGEVHTILARIFSNQTEVTLRPDPLGRGAAVMVLLPRGKFSGEVRNRIQQLLSERLRGEVLNYFLAMGAGDRARIHFHVGAKQEMISRVSREALKREVEEILRSWEERLADELERQAGEQARSLLSRYATAFSEEYRVAHAAPEVVYDILQVEGMRREGATVAIALTEARGREKLVPGALELKLYLAGERLVLSDFIPIIDNIGLRVVEMAPFTLALAEGEEITLYSFSVQNREGEEIPTERVPLLTESLLAIHGGEAPNDAFNALVLHAGLRWREADVLRAYANYAFQIGAVPSRPSAARALVRYPEVAALLLELFRTRFDPAPLPVEGEGASRESAMMALRSTISVELEKVTTLTDDRALRRIYNLIEGTVRTNYFRHGGPLPTTRSGGVPYLSFKVRCADVEELRKGQLLYEVFVTSARMDGIHLRAAPISRGGIRWSDRPDDFRTEVLGLVQTQIVKNAVIVPSGSKGGFITKRSFAERQAMMAEAEAQYRTLIRGLLDLTDNLVAGEVVPPPGVVRYDGDDPYLVVAADKGTAHLSDTANEVAAEYGFWLGDAFASGGSQGYDHKREGITARGAWECVRRHFREMGKDIQAEPFTVVGIGDMSGDVFGNGMLLSRQIRLLAAFDHRDIFIDPTPDPERSFQERSRLFALPRSSWQDYDRSLLSPGAMIIPRASKGVELTEQARAALGIEESVERLDGEALIRAVLQAPAELLWNGGIGTYVKGAEETHAEVGDSTNDPVRVDAPELRCRVVGEGGNLGFTQRARITYALRGGRINTDALDNSGGVDMSDHEVNLKILLTPAVTVGELSPEARNHLLREMTEDVSQLVLLDNVRQSLAVSLEEERSREALPEFAGLISSLERDRVLDRVVEGVPDAEELDERAQEGRGLTRPTLSVLLAYAKLAVKRRLLASSLLDDPALERYLASYFPARAVEAVGEARLLGHPLRREIITTGLASELVDLMGSTFLYRVARDSGQEVEQVIWAWHLASELAAAPLLRRELLDLEGKQEADTLYRWVLDLSRNLERVTRWVLNNVAPEAPAASLVSDLRTGLESIRAGVGELMAGLDQEMYEARLQEMESRGVERSFAQRLLLPHFLPEVLDTLRIAAEARVEPVTAARSYYRIAEWLSTAWLRQALRHTIQGAGHWEKRFGQGLLADVNRAHRQVAHQALLCQKEGRSLEECFAEYQEHRGLEGRAYLEVLEELRTSESVSLPAAAIAVRALQELARS